MVKIHNVYSRVGVRMKHFKSGLIVVTTGNHGDKTRRYSFEAYRVLDNGQLADETEWFQKMPFEEIDG